MKAVFVFLGVLIVAALGWSVLKPHVETDLLIDAATAQRTDESAVAVVLTFDNLVTPDRLLGARSELGAVTLFNPDPSGNLPVPLGRASLALDAAHILIEAGPESNETGALLPLTLTFEDAGELPVKARMTAPDMTGDMAGMDHAMMDHSMHSMAPAGPVPDLSIRASPDGDGWLLQIDTENFVFAADQVDMPHMPGHGHGHVYVGGMKLGQVFDSPYPIRALPSGSHVIRVTLNTNDHRPYTNASGHVTATTTIEVD